MWFKSQICFHLPRKRSSTNLKKLKTKTWLPIPLRALEILLSYLRFKTMLQTKADLRHSWMGNNTTTLRLNLDKTTTSQVRANCKMKFKSIKVKPSRELTNNLHKIKCGNRSIIIMGFSQILNSAILLRWYIILILILERILKLWSLITTVLTKNLRSKWEGITLLLVGSRSLQPIWLRIIILNNLTPTDWPWVDRSC